MPEQFLPRQGEDFPKGEKYLKHMRPLTYVIYFTPKGEYMLGSIYMTRSPHGTLINLSLVCTSVLQGPCFSSLLS